MPSHDVTIAPTFWTPEIYEALDSHMAKLSKNDLGSFSYDKEKHLLTFTVNPEHETKKISELGDLGIADALADFMIQEKIHRVHIYNGANVNFNFEELDRQVVKEKLASNMPVLFGYQSKDEVVKDVRTTNNIDLSGYRGEDPHHDSYTVRLELKMTTGR